METNRYRVTVGVEHAETRKQITGHEVVHEATSPAAALVIELDATISRLRKAHEPIYLLEGERLREVLSVELGEPLEEDEAHELQRARRHRDGQGEPAPHVLDEEPDGA